MSYGGYGFPNNYGMTYQQPNGFQNNFNNDSRYNRYMNMVEQQNNNNSQMTNTNFDFITVSSMQEAQDFNVPNGQIRWFRHTSKPEIYVKAVSAVGQPSFGAYELHEIDFNNSETKENKNYVTVDKFNELNSEVDRLKDIIIQQNNTIQELSKVKPTKTQNKEAK